MTPSGGCWNSASPGNDDDLLLDLEFDDSLLADSLGANFGRLEGLEGLDGFELDSLNLANLLCSTHDASYALPSTLAPQCGVQPLQLQPLAAAGGCTTSGGSGSCFTVAKTTEHFRKESGTALQLPCVTGSADMPSSQGATPSTSESGLGSTPGTTVTATRSPGTVASSKPLHGGSSVLRGTAAVAGTSTGDCVAAERAGVQAEQQLGLSEEERKKQLRMERNRQNAHLSRQRRKALLEELQSKCSQLRAQNVTLSGAVARLSAENASLKQQVALLAAVAARAAPAAASSQATGAHDAAAPAAAPAVPHEAAGGPAGVSTANAATQPLAAGGGAPCPAAPLSLPLPLLFPPGRPAAAAAAQPAAAQQPAPPPQAVAAAPVGQTPAACTPAASADGGGRKRRRTGSAAATAFVALFSLFMLCHSPLLPVGLRGGAGAGTGSGLPALSDARASAAGMYRTGRVLQALPAAGPEQPVRQPPLPAPLEHEPPPPLLQLVEEAVGKNGGGAAALALPASSSHLAELLNSTLEALLEQPGNQQLERKALARLQELAPVALLLDADGSNGGVRAGDGPRHSPLDASAAFPQLAGQLFKASGLQPPQMCRKVFEFDAASLPNVARSRRSLERFLLGQHGFRGRSLAAGAPDSSLARPGADPAPAGASDDAMLRLEAAGSSQEDVLPVDAVERVASGSGAEGVDSVEDDGDVGLPLVAQSMEPTLVSVLLPTNASSGEGSEGGDRQLTAVDKVFVVMLHPRQRYVTYSCSLPQAVLV